MKDDSRKTMNLLKKTKKKQQQQQQQQKTGVSVAVKPKQNK
jgi:hypothetical protein